MKRKYYLWLISLILGGTAWGQAVPNPSFELWNPDNIDLLARWFNSNTWAKSAFGAPNVTKTTDAHGGTYAVRLETFANATDSIFGYIANTPGDPSLGEGGLPYTAQPDTLRGWAKYDILPNDTGLVIVMFKAGGALISTDFFFFTGTASSYTYFEMPLSLASTPDSVVFAFASSWPDQPTLQDGSWLMLDDLSFNLGPAIANGNFEQWATYNHVEPVGWTSPDQYGDTAEVVTRSTDAITGQYAVQVTTKSIFSGQDTLGYLTSGRFNGGSQSGGQPYNLTTDTLCGYYKYTGIGADSAIIGAVFSQGGNMIGVAAQYFDSKNQYTYFEIPFQLGQTPDTVRIDIWSSNPGGMPMPGSTLIVDSLRFKSDPLVGLPTPRPALAWTIFPNPSSGNAWMEIVPATEGNYRLEVFSVTGARLLQQTLALQAGRNRIPLDLQALAPGTYLVRLQGDGNFQTLRLTVE
jgi:Secretion system C-terminal sorting domain